MSEKTGWLRSEKVPYADCPVCPKCGCRGIPYFDKNGIVQYGCSICPWRGFWRFWVTAYPAHLSFEVSLRRCAHCKYELERERWCATFYLCGLSLLFNCHSFQDVEGPPPAAQPVVHSKVEADTLDADVIF